MKGLTAIYQGKVVKKAHFRAYVYAPNGSHHLVESWDEFEKKMESGLWFATKEQAQESAVSIGEELVAEEKPKRTRKAKVITEEINEEFISVECNQEVEDAKNEVDLDAKQDDFLPTNKA